MLSPWHEDRLKELRRLVADGLSASQIGEALLASRNSIIGICRRQGIRLGNDVGWPVARPKRTRRAAPGSTILKTSSPAKPASVQINGEAIHGSDRNARKGTGCSDPASARRMRDASGTSARSEQVGACPVPDNPVRDADPPSEAADVSASVGTELIIIRGVDIMALGMGVCRFPLGGHHEKPPFRYCGADAIGTEVYCPHHSRIAFSGTRDAPTRGRPSQFVAFR